MLNFEVLEMNSWKYIEESKKTVVIYGMGNGADKLIDNFKTMGIEILGITASDDFVRGQIFRDFKVKKLSEFDGSYILVIAFGTCVESVINHIYSLDEEYDLVVPVVPVIGNVTVTEDFVVKNAENINRAYNIFSDESKKIFENVFNFLYSGRLKYLKLATTEKNEIFERFLTLTEKEVYLDLGAYNGDTIIEFLKYANGKYNRIIAVEPNIKNYKKLLSNCEHLSDFFAYNKAVSDDVKTVIFSSLSGRQSSISEKGVEIKTLTIDEISKIENITYIKIDVEGGEINAINGGENTIKRCKPKLNIALYHRFSDLFEIPNLIYKLNPNYQFEIRKHPYIPCWDLNLYCK